MKVDRITLLNRLYEIKTKLYEADADHAGDLLNGVIFDLTGYEYLCDRCGRGLSAEDFHVRGELCECCCFVIGCHSDAV